VNASVTSVPQLLVEETKCSHPSQVLYLSVLILASTNNIAEFLFGFAD